MRFKAVKTEYYDPKAFVETMKPVADRTVRRFQDDFKKTTQGFKTRITFRTVKKINDRGWIIAVGTDNEIYAYLNYGTKPHAIRPKKARRLRFRGGYTSKTVPGRLNTRPGGSSGDYVSAKEVQHPGTDARNFDKEIVRRNQQPIVDDVKDAFREAAKKRKSRP